MRGYLIKIFKISHGLINYSQNLFKNPKAADASLVLNKAHQSIPIHLNVVSKHSEFFKQQPGRK